MPSPATLADALARYDVTVPADLVAPLQAYCASLWEKNTALNLTRHTDYDQFVRRDLVDSIQLANLIEPGETVLDIGSGGGAPGLVVAILRPDVEMTLCESVGKKAEALSEIVADLRMPVPVIAGRAEDLLEDHGFHVVTARAVASLTKLLTWLAPHWESVGRLLLTKGVKWAEERGEARHVGLLKPLNLRKVAEYDIPGDERHAVGKSVILKLWPKGREPSGRSELPP